MFQKFTNANVTGKHVLDRRVSRLNGWLLANFTSAQLTVRFTPGHENKLADLMSRWKQQPMKNVDVEGNKLGDEIWGRLHVDHAWMATMLHRCK